MYTVTVSIMFFFLAKFWAQNWLVDRLTYAAKVVARPVIDLYSTIARVTNVDVIWPREWGGGLI